MSSILASPSSFISEGAGIDHRLEQGQAFDGLGDRRTPDVGILALCFILKTTKLSSGIRRSKCASARSRDGRVRECDVEGMSCPPPPGASLHERFETRTTSYQLRGNEFEATSDSRMHKVGVSIAVNRLF